MNCHSQLKITVASFALIATFIASAATAAETPVVKPIPRIRVPVAVPTTETAPTPQIQRRIPEPIKEAVPTPEPTSPPTPRVNLRRILTPVDPSPSADVESAPPPPIRIRPPVSVPPPTEASPPLARRRTPVIAPSASTEVESLPRVRSRIPATIESDAAVGQAPTVRRRIGAPALDTTTPVTVPGPGVIRSIESVQTDCLFRPNKNPAKPAQSASAETVNTLALVCRVNGTATLMSFSYDRPAEKYAADARSLAAKHHEGGLTSIVAYAIKPSQTDAAGMPVYQLLTIAPGEPSRKQLACIVQGITSLAPTFNGDAKGTTVQKWCLADAKVSPVSFRVNRWIEPERPKGVSISSSDPQDKRRYTGVSSVIYDDAFSADADGSALIRNTEAQIDEKSWDCVLGGTDPGSLYCTSNPVKGVETTYLAFSMPEIRQQIGALLPPQCATVVKPVFDDAGWSHNGQGGTLNKFTRYYDYKITTCDTPKIAYRLLKGTVPAQYRAQTNGACYLASAAGVTPVKIVTITYARAVEATVTGQGMELELGGEQGQIVNIVAEGRTIGTNGSIDPNTTLNVSGERVPISVVTKVNAPCT